MTLPLIKVSRLQRAVAEAEYPDSAESFEALCEFVETTAWAINLKLDSSTIGHLIVAHDIVTKVTIPETVAEEPAAPTLTNTATPPPVSDSSKKAGKGKKFCPSCKEIIGARSAVCKHCSHKFKNPNAPKPTPTVSPDEDDERPTVVEIVLNSGVKQRPEGLGVTSIHTPAGSCPYKLQSTSLDDVRDWAEKIRDSGFPPDGERGTLYTYGALRYWATHFYNQTESFNNPDSDFSVVVGHLEALYPFEVRI